MAKKDKAPSKTGATRLKEEELKKVTGGYHKYDLTNAVISGVKQNDDDASER